MAFEAKYDGQCDECGARIHPGDLITSDLKTGRYVHVVCPDDPQLLKANETVCDKCWLVQPCECEAS